MTLRKNVSGQHISFVMRLSATGAVATGKTVTPFVTKDGADASPGGTVTEVGNGRYDYALSQGDTNCAALQVLFTETDCIAAEFFCYTTAANPGDAVRFGLTALPNAAADAAGGLVISDAGGLDIDAKLATATSALSTAANLSTAQTAITAIKAKTDSLTFTSAGKVDANTLAIGADVITAASMAADAGTEIAAAIGALAMVEPTAVPAVTATLKATLSWLLALSRNKITQTATTQILKADDGSTTIATSTHSDDATTHTRGEFA